MSFAGRSPCGRRSLAPQAAAAVVVMTLAAVVFAASPSDYKVVDGWGELPTGVAWGEVPGVSLDRSGTVIAFRRAEPPILEFTPSGKLVKSWGQGLFVMPHGLRVDAEGSIWATDARATNGKGQQVFKFSRDGRLLLTLGTAGVSGDSETTFNGPCDVAVASNGDVFVADGHVNSRIVKFSKDGTFLKAWGRKGTGPGEFDVPHAVVIDSRGRVLVGDRNNKRIELFDQDGRFLEQWTHFGRPSGLFIAPDDTLYVGDVSDQKGIVVGSARDGRVAGVIAGSLPEGIAVAPNGDIYAGETTTGHTLRKLIVATKN